MKQFFTIHHKLIMKHFNLTSSILTSDELSTLINRIVAECIQNNADDLQMQRLTAFLLQQNQTLTDSLFAVRKSPHTALLLEKDDHRDEVFKGLRNFITAHLYHPREEVRQASVQLHELIKKHGFGLYRFGYQKESAAINSLLMELAKPNYAEMITKLGANDWVKALISAQADFEKCYSNRVAEEGKEIVEPSTEMRKLAIESLEKLLMYIETQLFISETPDRWGTLSANLQRIIGDTNAAARIRRTHKEAAKTKENQATQGITE